jgi:hypothetical protein
MNDVRLVNELAGALPPHPAKGVTPLETPDGVDGV